MNKKEYPYNFIADTFRLTTDEEWKTFEEEAPKAIEATVERILDAVALSQRNKKVIYARYKDNMTLAEIGKKFGCCSRNVEVIINGVQRRFRVFYFGNFGKKYPMYYQMSPCTYPYNLLAKLYPSDEWDQTFIREDPREVVERVESFVEEIPEEDKKIFYSFFRDGMSYVAISEKFEIPQGRVPQIIGSCLTELKKKMFPNKRDEKLVAEDMEKMSSILLDDDIKKRIAGIHISELELDTRCFNAVNRKGIRTLVDIVVYNYNNNGDWSKIRNMGPKSFDVLKNAVREYGIDIG